MNEQEMIDQQEMIAGMEDDELSSYGMGYPKMQEKVGVWEFFKKILGVVDSTKVANLNEDELYYVRLYQQAANYAAVFGLDEVAKHLIKDQEIVLASSDSKNGFLITTAVTQKKSFEAKSGYKQQGRSGWFKKKQDQQAEQE